jgi:hypothetical protein
MSPPKAAFCAVLCLVTRTAFAADPPPIAVFPYEINDTSGEVGGPDQAARSATATALLAKTLKETGHYTPVDLAPYAKQIAGLQRPDECGECWAAVARKAGATYEVLPSVHKVSTLITLMTLWFADVRTMQYVARVEGQIRGDTDEAYARGIHFLITEELDKALAQAKH